MKKLLMVFLGMVSLVSIAQAQADSGRIGLVDSSMGGISSVYGTIQGAAAEQMFSLLGQGKSVRKGVLKVGGCIPGAEVIGDVVEGRGLSCVKYLDNKRETACIFDLDSEAEFSAVSLITHCE